MIKKFILNQSIIELYSERKASLNSTRHRHERTLEN